LFIDSQSFIASVRKGEKVDFSPLYKHFPMIERMIKQNNGSKDDAKDIFQNTLLAFYNNCCKKEFSLTVKIETYLYSIAHNLWLKELNRTKDFINSEKIELVEEESGDKVEKEVLIDKMNDSFDRLSEQCQQLIKLFHYQSMSWEEIMYKLGYKNEHAARNQKYKCLQKLKSMM
jgi:RNA polymerase sigma factor (sigma-70 family)